MKAYKEKLSKYLDNNGLKLTKEREKILREIAGYHEHFEAESFLEKLNNKGLNISRPTFYRALNLFINAGLISKSNLEDGRVIYEHILHHGHHDHFVCTSCGKIIEFSDPDIERKQNSICEKYKFKGLRHQMQIFGICSRCNR